jgi:hypothetical protein
MMPARGLTAGIELQNGPSHECAETRRVLPKARHKGAARRGSGARLAAR